MNRTSIVCGLAMLQLFSISVGGATEKELTIPPTPKHPETHEYHGIRVTDDYQWLENSSNPEVKTWTEKQSAYTRQYLDRIPFLKAIKSKLTKWNEFKTPKYFGLQYRAGKFFALKLQPPKNQPMLMALTSVDDLKTEKTLVDPNAMDASGTTAIDFFVPSVDGKTVAVSISKGGSEIGTLHLYDVTSGKELGDTIENVNKPTGGGSVAWIGDGSGFYYTRYPHEGERAKEDLDFYQQVWFHKLGTPASEDRYSIGKDFPRIAEIALSSSEDGRYILATVANGDGGEYEHFVLLPESHWTQIDKFTDKNTVAQLGKHDDLYVVSLKDAPKGRVLSLSLKNPKLSEAKLVIPETDGVIEDITPTDTRIYVTHLAGGPSEIRVFQTGGQAAGTMKTPELSQNSNVVSAGGDRILFFSQSYVEPLTWYEYAPGGKEMKGRKTAMATQSPVSFKDIAVKREFAKSKDGTAVPITILYRKGLKLNSNNPAILYAYGGYSVSLKPRFMPDLHLWLEQGGVYAVANIRGGGEFGESWHLAGNLTKKQNVFDDFIASAEHLISRKYTSKQKLAIEGGSNGGLLMGAALTQRPDLFRAVVSHVGIYDMLRVELDPNGAFNVTEFGTVKSDEQFKALHAYSPVHHVVNGTNYPAVLLLTGANDGRVNPYHSKKMAARLQAASADLTTHPVLLRVTFNAGHGMGRSVAQKVDEEADVYAFLLQQLGLQFR